MVNAAGISGDSVLRNSADLRITQCSRREGSLLILDHRINNLVINRCRKPADADRARAFLVPGAYHFAGSAPLPSPCIFLCGRN
ncbi:hypothetical protein LNQ03_27200 [Klebsiella pneumoniae subsp. pneumoniae]|nr:hypothetical protein [Klebsiella pneumoniae subsp. pneumoniae]